MTNFREMLRCYRATHHIGTAELARRMGIPRSTLAQFEARATGTSGATLARMLCWALGTVSNSRDRVAREKF